MKLQHLVFALLVLLLTDYYGLAASKSSPSTGTSTKVSPATTAKPADKAIYPKKVSTLKKRPSKPSLKKVADITEKFKDLPADDLAFIKELDKQFKLHGGKVKIKVENDNTTTAVTSKNSKRTIEGELGYGYSHNGYDYSPPKYMFYPYSQQDISHNAPKYYIPDGKTEVSIEPSYSYELKPQNYAAHNEHHQEFDLPHAEALPEQGHHGHAQEEHHSHQYEAPVIVLRIPGPAKYASHLQTLLQQYLEIRAAQYLKILEETEHHQHHQHQQQQLQQVEYQQGHEHHQQQQHAVHDHAQQQQHAVEEADYEQQHGQPQYVPQQQAQYPDIDHVYQHYKHRHQTSHIAAVQQHQQQEQPPQQPEHPQQQLYYVPNHGVEQQQQHYVTQHAQEQPQFYYSHEQQYAQPEGPPANTYQHIFLLSMIGPAQAEYESQQEHAEPQIQHQPVYVPEPEHEQQQQQHYEAPSAPVLTENNPRSSHTKVIFTHNNEHASDDYTHMYPLPSIKPNDRIPPKSVPDYHQDYQNQPHPYNVQQQSQESAQHYQQQEQAGTAPAAATQHQQPQQVVAITQRPYNYHAKAVKPRAKGRNGHHKRRVVKNTDDELKNIREYVRENLGARTGSEVEYKTKTVIEE